MTIKYEPVDTLSKLTFGVAVFCAVCHTFHGSDLAKYCQAKSEPVEMHAGMSWLFDQEFPSGAHGRSASSSAGVTAGIVYFIPRF